MFVVGGAASAGLPNILGVVAPFEGAPNVKLDDPAGFAAKGFDSVGALLAFPFGC